MKKIGLYIVVYFAFISCDYLSLKEKSDKKVIAKVYDSFLYEDDIKDFLPENIEKNDSIIMVSNFINSWAKQRLLLHKSELNLADRSAGFEKLVKEYREDLYINAYKEAVVRQDLDTIVTEQDVAGFYEENKDNFKLNEELLKFRFIHIGNEVTNPKSFVQLFRSTKKEDLYALEEQELQLKSFNLNDSTWIKYDEVIAKIPALRTYDKKEILKKSNFIQKEDSLGLYLMTIKDVLKRNDIAPLSYIAPTIKRMILHKRKLELFRKIEQTLIDDAIKNKQFEVY